MWAHAEKGFAFAIQFSNVITPSFAYEYLLEFHEDLVENIN